MARVQTAVGLCLSAAVWRPLPRIHPMGRPGQPGVQGGRPQRTGTSLGKPQGEHPGLWDSPYRENEHTGGETKQPKQGTWEQSKCCTAGPWWLVIFFYRTETIWPMRKCPVLCVTTTSSTSSKRSGGKNFFSGLCPLSLCHSSSVFPPQPHTHLLLLPLLCLRSGFWNSHRASGNYRLTLLSHQNTAHLRTGTFQTAVLHMSSVRTILRFPLIVLLHSLLHRKKKRLLNVLNTIQQDKLLQNKMEIVRK